MLGQDRLFALEVTWMIQDSGSLDFEDDSQLLKAFAQFPKIRFVILKKKDIIHGIFPANRFQYMSSLIGIQESGLSFRDLSSIFACR